MKKRALAIAASRFPIVSGALAGRASSWASEGVIPWTPLRRPLGELSVAIVTTAGVHHRWQRPFDMEDPDGDPGFRELSSDRPTDTLTITHDYYDHRDADRDINVVYPIERLGELVGEGVVGGVSGLNLGFMGHIDGRHLKTLVEETAPEAARRLRAAGAGAVVLTPG